MYFRLGDIRPGTLVGVDKFGNKYYENKQYFFGKRQRVNSSMFIWGVGRAHFFDALYMIV